MWIRSQDRLRLLNLNGFNYLNENNEHKILGFDTSSDNDDMYWLLGEYSTKEKGIKVLDMLQEEILKAIYLVNTVVGEFEMDKDKFFEMPQDDEVE